MRIFDDIFSLLMVLAEFLAGFSATKFLRQQLAGAPSVQRHEACIGHPELVTGHRNTSVVSG